MLRYVSRRWLIETWTNAGNITTRFAQQSCRADYKKHIVKVWHEHWTYDCTAKYGHVALANFLNHLFFEVLECGVSRSFSATDDSGVETSQ